MIWLLYILLDSRVSWWLIVKKKTTPYYWSLRCFRGAVAITYASLWLQTVGTFDSIAHAAGHIILPFPFLFNASLALQRHVPVQHMGAKSGWIEPFVVRHKLDRWYFALIVAMFAIGIKYFI